MPEALARDVASLGEALGRPAPPAAVGALARYVQLVERFGRRMNLSAAKEGSALVEVLLADALVLADEALVPVGARVVDVGSGAGAPCLPLLVLRPDLRATLVEPIRKRVAFLRTAVGSLGLEDRARVLERRVELGDDALVREGFDVALSRATLAPGAWLALGLSLAGRALVLTAAHDPPAPPAGGAVAVTRAYALPSTGAPRVVTAYDRPSGQRPSDQSR